MIDLGRETGTDVSNGICLGVHFALCIRERCYESRLGKTDKVLLTIGDIVDRAIREHLKMHTFMLQNIRTTTCFSVK